MSSSDEITSDSASSASETSDSINNSSSESASCDSDSGTNDENASSVVDEETGEEETDSNTDTSGDIAEPSKPLSAVSPNIGSSQTIFAASAKQSDTTYVRSTSNHVHLENVNSQTANWDDSKLVGKPASGTDSTETESPKSDSYVCGSTIPPKLPPETRKSGKSISTRNTAKSDVKSDSISHAKSDSDRNCLPPELAGGWGEEPGPAPWDWQAMPFDYMGILEEQRRTVFYEFHEHNGKGEWIDPKYHGLNLLRIS